jgi:hypothetical protein
MNKALILAEWHRAQDSLRAAELLTTEECYADAVSRTYYTILHAAKAALHAEGVAADSHASVRRMFGLHLIKSGQIDKAYAVDLGESFDDRLSADYDPEVEFSRTEARRECRIARHFLARMRRFLISKGFASAELRRRKKP